MKPGKRCLACDTHRPYSQFYRDKSRPDGYSSQCKRCKESRKLRTINADPSAYLRNSFNKLKSSRLKEGRYEFLITLADVEEKWLDQGGRCAITNQKMTHHLGAGTKDLNASIDRIDSTVGYTPENIQLVCGRVNLMKGVLPEDDLLHWCRAILSGYSF